MTDQTFTQFDTNYPSPQDVAPRERRGLSRTVMILAIIMTVCVVVRLALVVTYDFPLHGGGFLAAQVQTLQANDFRIPATLPFNGNELPFAQPPLPVYLLAALDTFLGVDVEVALHYLPVFISILALPAVYILMQTFFDRPRLSLLGTAVFAALPSTTYNVVSGSGLGTAMGMLFAALALWQAVLLFAREERYFLYTTGVLLALTLLSDRQWGVMVAISILTLYIFSDRSIAVTLELLALTAVTIVLLSPWLVTVIRQNGIAPYVNSAFLVWEANRPFETIIAPGRGATMESAFALMSVLAIIGLFVALARGMFRVVGWNVAVFALSPDATQIVTALPIAFAITLALDLLVLTGIGSFRRGREGPPTPDGAAPPRRYFREDWAITVSYALVGLLLLLPLFTPTYNQVIRNEPLLTPVPIEKREAMAWVRENTDTQTARFALLTTAPDYESDSTAEWFPVLAERESFSTITGAEWQINANLASDIAFYNELQTCPTQQLSCIEQWALESGKSYTHVWFGPGTRGRLSDAMDASAAYTLIYDENDILIYAR